MLVLQLELVMAVGLPYWQTQAGIQVHSQSIGPQLCWSQWAILKKNGLIAAESTLGLMIAVIANVVPLLHWWSLDSFLSSHFLFSFLLLSSSVFWFFSCVDYFSYASFCTPTWRTDWIFLTDCSSKFPSILFLQRIHDLKFQWLLLSWLHLTSLALDNHRHEQE